MTVQAIRSGYQIKDERNRNADAAHGVIELSKLVRSGEVVGFHAAIQYADGSTGNLGGGHCRSDPIIGALYRAADGIIREEQ